MLQNFSSFGSPEVTFMKGKLSVWGFEGCRVSRSPAILCVLIVDHPPEMPVLRCVSLGTARSLLRQIQHSS